MNEYWNYDLATQHGDALREDARHARLSREARASRGSAQYGRSPSRRRRLAAATGALLAAGATYAIASAASPVPASSATPHQCTQSNSGGQNGCSVGNSANSGLPHQRVGYTPNECIRINGGDYNACNVGNSGGGDRPYRTVSP